MVDKNHDVLNTIAIQEFCTLVLSLLIVVITCNQEYIIEDHTFYTEATSV